MPALTMKALRTLFSHDVRHAESVLLQDGHLAPMFAATSGDGRLLPVMADFGSPEAKEACITAVRLLCIAKDAMMAVHMAEAWLVVGDLAPGVSPGQSDRRVEAVLVSIDGRIGGGVKRLSSVREILRGADGRPTGLHPLTLPGGTRRSQVDLGGPMSELLPPRLPTRERRLVARVALERMEVPKPA